MREGRDRADVGLRFHVIYRHQGVLMDGIYKELPGFFGVETIPPKPTSELISDHLYLEPVCIVLFFHINLGSRKTQQMLLSLFIGLYTIICIHPFMFPFDWFSALQFVTFGNIDMQELEFPEEQIQVSDALTEMSQGQWEGCPKSEIYTPEMVNLMDSTQPDFSAPAGESLRQVQFRMMEFLNQTIVRLPEKVAMGDTLSQQNDTKGLSRQSSTNSVQDGPPWDLLYRLNRHGLQRKKSGKSRLQFVTSGDNETEDEFSPKEINQRHTLHEANLAQPSVTSIAIFSHAAPIRCLVAGVLDCNPMISQRICIEDSSITVLEHSLKTGWQIKRLNDSAHLRLL
uniref:Uncharacterized protein n=1 Tax=Oryza brachyantha TaxID=4533 RepID=J3N8N6_ORYBR